MKTIYLEDQSLTDLIKIARRNLRDMQPNFKVQVVDRVLEIIAERVEAIEKKKETDKTSVEIFREITDNLLKLIHPEEYEKNEWYDFSFKFKVRDDLNVFATDAILSKSVIDVSPNEKIDSGPHVNNGHADKS